MGLPGFVRFQKKLDGVRLPVEALGDANGLLCVHVAQNAKNFLAHGCVGGHAGFAVEVIGKGLALFRRQSRAVDR